MTKFLMRKYFLLMVLLLRSRRANPIIYLHDWYPRLSGFLALFASG